LVLCKPEQQKRLIPVSTSPVISFGKKYLVILVLLLFSVPVSTTTIHRLRTVHLTESGFSALDAYQKIYFSSDTVFFFREQRLTLPVTDSMEMEINVPMFETIGNNPQSGLGDISLYFSRAVFSRDQNLINAMIELSPGNGLQFSEKGVIPVEHYGYPEWKLGAAFFSRFGLIDVQSNLWYAGRMHKGEGQEPGIFSGLDLNIFSESAWNRWLGFHPDKPENFFYKNNFANDAFEASLVLNSDILFPWIPFVSWSSIFPFHGEREKVQSFAGITHPLHEISAGIKLLVLSAGISIVVTVFYSPTIEDYSTGMGAGLRAEF